MRETNASFTEYFKSSFIFLSFFKYFRSTKHSLQLLFASIFPSSNNVIKILDRFLLEFFFSCTQVNPPFNTVCLQTIIWIVVDKLLNNLTGSFELLCMPQKCCGTNQIFIRSLFFSFIQLQNKGVNCFLVDMSASLVIKYESYSCWKADFAPFLNSSELTDRLCYTAFVEYSKCFPES
jgi:hypothetical protein